jgi:hypothetical protein
MRTGSNTLLVCLLAGALLPLARAEEGMWTFDNLPLKQLKEKYGFTPTRQWIDHVRLSSVRFNDGGSGSFVSPHGLVLTNHHVALSQLQKVSSEKQNYVASGFYAATRDRELKSPDLEVNVLMSMENVTSRVMSVITPGMSDQNAFQARKAEIAKIEKESLDKTGLRSDVVILYSGGEYWLYRYKKYTDVRLVFAPEQGIAFFGGDPDNFTYPRYDLDMALFRIYENGVPVESKDFLRFNPKGAHDGELVFVSGNPGSTSRLDTLAQLEYQRDSWLPLVIRTLQRRSGVLKEYSSLGTEQAREAKTKLFLLANSLKALGGMYNGLQDPKLMARKEASEKEFRGIVATQHPEYAAAWTEIAAAVKQMASRLDERFALSHSSNLTGTVQTIVQYVAEVKKPDGQRLPGFHDAQLGSLRFEMFSPAPVYPALEQVELADDLSYAQQLLGPRNAYVKAVLEGHSPAEVAAKAIQGTKLADPKVREALVKGGEPAVDASDDPLIVLARKMDPFSREFIKWREDNVESVLTEAGQKIGKARFAAYGKSTYPDATFTLRLSYGTVKGYPMNGTIAPPETTFFGLYDRATSFGFKPPFNLPERYIARRDRLDLSTPLDFVNTCDIIGGNSGSPVINRDGELVGLIFDGNIESLVGDYIYDIETNRAVAVHPGAMMEALRKLYDAPALVNELEAPAQSSVATK